MQLSSTHEIKRTLQKPRSHLYLRIGEALLARFSPAERLALYVLSIVLGLSALALLAGINSAISVDAPTRGGTITEGETTPARFINPVLALSQADQDLTQLVYSGLMRARPDGTFIPDLAETYTISDDGTVYTFTLKRGLSFHDGAALTAADILYTVSLAQNPDTKSPRRADWDGVQVATPDPRTIVFTLPHAYAPFIENATLGILPKHLWEKTPSDSIAFNTLNTHPIGSGPYQVSGLDTDTSGAPTRYDLAPFRAFALGTPHLERISFVFYANDDELVRAYNAGSIDAIAGATPTDLDALSHKGASLVRKPLPRVFGVFFNQSKNPALTDASVRRALDTAVDKQSIVDATLGGYGVTLSSPVPPGVLNSTPPASPAPFTTRAATSTTDTSANADAARAVLEKGGWKYASSSGWTLDKQTLSIKLATADEPELVAAANAVVAAWRAAGIDASVAVYPLSDFNNTVLRPRAYDAILFGEVVGRDADLFAFWHSSQRNDPGLNLALYANTATDKILATARSTNDLRTRISLYAKFASLVEKDRPAIFLYSPEFLYILPASVRGVQIGALTTPSERFLNVYQWYTSTEHVWSFFANEIN